MARIVYAASGDGQGHGTRAHSVGAGLMGRGHDVRFVSCLRGSRYLLEQFPDRVEEIFGFELTYENGRTKPLKSILNMAREGIRDVGPTLRRLDRFFRGFQPDLLISDMETFTPRVARRRGVPFVSLDNLHLLTHCRVERPPGSWRDYVSARGFVRMVHTGARHYYITSFIDAPIRHQPTTLLPPVLREKLYAMETTTGDYLVAYLGASGGRGHIPPALEQFQSMPIRAYGFGLTGQRGRVCYETGSSELFLKDLAGCAGVVASAGYSLISECLHLRKPMLLLPIGKQFEQWLNAYHVQRMGFGRYAHELTLDVMNEFLEGLDRYRAALRHYPRVTLAPVLDALERELPS